MPVDQRTKPNFAAWSLENLSNFASEAFDRMVEQAEAIEQLRLDLRTAMQELRIATTNQDDWK